MVANTEMSILYYLNSATNVGSGTKIEGLTQQMFNNYNRSQSDGEIGLYRQGRGDCYLLASLSSISQTKAGARILKENIKQDNQGNYVITLPGAVAVKNNYARDGKTCYISGRYTISKYDVMKARVSREYSKGDVDVLLYELAFEKYREEVLKTNRANGLPNVQGVAGQTAGDATMDNLLDGGQSRDAIFILTGKKSKQYSISPSRVEAVDREDIKAPIYVTEESLSKRDTEHFLDKIQKEPGRYAVTFSLKVKNGGRDAHHALTVTRVEGDKIYFVNPWNSGKELSMTREEFFYATYAVTVADFGRTGSGVNGANNNVNINQAWLNRLSQLLKK